MKSNKNKKKKLLAAAAALALVAAISGTFAWITAQDQRINRVESAKVTDGSVTIREKWESKPLVPGTEATKEVSITNSGSAKVFVRVSYEEVLKHLTNLGATTTRTTPYTPGATDLGVDMPVNVADSYTLDPKYTDITTSTNVTGLPANHKLFVKGGATTDPISGTVSYDYELVCFYEYASGEYQKVDFTHNVTNDQSSPGVVYPDAADWDITVSAFDYYVYPAGYQHTVANWAESAFENNAVTPSVTGYALLDTAGTKHSVTYDYTASTLGLTLSPTIVNLLTAADTDILPVASTDQGVQADTLGLSESEIRIRYGADITTVAAMAADSWVFNMEDGWFYYTEPLSSGKSTPDLLKSLVFTSSMGTEYTNASYDLIVKMEAIQASGEAMSSATGWNLGTPTPSSDTETIYNTLVSRI